MVYGLAPEDTEYYAIHDGARPLVTQDCIRSAIQGAVRYGAAAAGMRVKDTIERIGAGGRRVSKPPNGTAWWRYRRRRSFAVNYITRRCAVPPGRDGK